MGDCVAEETNQNPETDEAREAWLKSLAEARSSQNVTCTKGMWSSQSLYFSTRRCTQSDVLSIITTPIAFPTDSSSTWGKNLILKPKHPPFPETKGTYTSPLLQKSLDLGRIKHDELHFSLKSEKIKFMEKLQVRRVARREKEFGAATKVQLVARGWLMRRWIKKNKKRLLLQAKVKRSYKIINRQIKLKLEMEENAKKAEERRERASMVIQAACRVFFARRAANRERYVRHIERLAAAQRKIASLLRQNFSRKGARKLRYRNEQERVRKSTVLIQSCYRRHKAFSIMYERRFFLQMIATSIIQCAWRQCVARATRRKRGVTAHEVVKNNSAITIQRMFRGHLGRKRAAAKKKEKDLAHKHAAALRIQRCYRGHRGRILGNFFKSVWTMPFLFSVFDVPNMPSEGIVRQIWGALFIQRWWRRVREEKKFQNLLNAKERDIFYQAMKGNAKRVEDLFAGFYTEEMYSIHSCDDHGNTVLLIAVKFGHRKIMKKCLRWGMDINHKNDKFVTATQIAVRHNHENLAEYLVSKKARLNTSGRTLLHEAAERGYEKLVPALVKRRVPPNERDPLTGNTALHCAMLSSHHVENVVKALCEGGADLSAVNKFGSTPLHVAATLGNLRGMRALLGWGADVSIKDNERRTPWRCALEKDHKECAAELRSQWNSLVHTAETTQQARGISDSKKDKLFEMCAAGDERYEEIEEALVMGVPADMQGGDGKTMLMAAAEGGAERIMELLLSKGAHVHIVDAGGRTAMHYAALSSKCSMRLLVTAGADVSHQDEDGNTPIHFCAQTGKLPDFIVANMASLGAHVDDYKNSRGETALHSAARHGKDDVVLKLIGLGASVSAAASGGLTPLHLAASHPKGLICVEHLLKADADPAANDDLSQTPLHAACIAGTAYAMMPLLEHKRGAELVSIGDIDGRSPLHLASMNARIKCVNMLFGNGASANPDLDSKNGASPLYYAIESNSEAGNECVRAIIGKGAALDARFYNPPEATAMHIAARCGNVYAIEALCGSPSGKETLRARDSSEATPLQVAVEQGHCSAAQALLSFGADPMLDEYIGGATEEDEDMNRTLLHAAANAAIDSEELVEQLLAIGFSTTENDALDLLPIHLAASANNPGALQSLLKRSPETANAVDKDGKTPMHCAAEANSVKCLQVLLQQYGADQEAVDSEGRTPLQAASERDADDAVEFLVTGVFIDPDASSQEGGGGGGADGERDVTEDDMMKALGI